MESEAKILQAIFDHAALGIAQISLDGSWLRVNDRYCQMLGYSEAELLTRKIWDITRPADYDEVSRGRRQLLEGTISSHSMEKRFLRKDGTVFWGKLNRSLVRNSDNHPQYFIAVVEDITDKIQSEHALRDAERRLSLVQNAAHLGIWDRDLVNNVIITSGDYNSLYGLAPNYPPLTCDEWLGLVHPDDRQRVDSLLRDALDRTRVWNAEFRVVWPDGSVHWLLGKGSVLLDDSGRPARFTGINLDITESKRVDQALRESEERFRRVFEEGPLGLALVGKDFRFFKVNSALCKMVGYTEAELVQLTFADITHPEDLRADVELADRLFNGELPVYQLRKRYVKKNREIIWINLTGALIRDRDGLPLYGVAMIEDITEMKRTQEEILVRQKLEGVGFLAGGIAHDFNNLLGGILAQAELGQADLSAGWSPVKELHRIKEAAIHGAEIVRELMIYSGQDKAGPVEPVGLAPLVEEMLELLRVSISKHAVLKIDLKKNLPLLLGNAAQIRQVLMNLIINASEAIGEKEGVINVTASHVVLPRNAGPDLPSGEYLNLEVSDTGGGMTEEVQAKVFDPFFSTKFAGRGLGLAVVQGIVRDHGGAINLVSAPGQGTKFEIFLPCVDERVHSSHSPSAQASVKEDVARGRTILVVEDEGVLRVAVSRMLQKKGFAVIEAGDGSSALELIRAHGNNIDVMLLDITLPGVSSREVFEQAQCLRPNLKVILTSAYGIEAVNASFEGLRVEHFIRKPFQFVDLMGILQDALPACGEPQQQ